jgi:predicted nucleic acid-binding protein
LTDPLFFDTDCISAFLWVGEESLLPTLYPKRLVLPRPVYVELSHPAVSHLKTRIDIMISARQIEIAEIFVGTEEYDQYYRLTTAPEPGHKLIGKGEASSIALAKVKGVNFVPVTKITDDQIRQKRAWHEIFKPSRPNSPLLLE